MVIVIIGVLSMLTIPAVTGGDMTRVKSASRALMQMSRYARTMAVLHQCTVELHIYPDGRLVTVPRTNPSAASAQEEGSLGLAASSANELEEMPDAAAAGDESGVSPVAVNPDELGGTMAEIEEEKEFKRIVFELESSSLPADSYEEQIKERGGDGEYEGEESEEQAPWIVPFGGNGRCPPFMVKVMSADDNGEPERDAFYLEVRVDRFGAAKVFDEKDSQRDRD